MLWICFCKKRGEFNLLPTQTGISRKNPLHRITGCNGRGDIVYRHTRAPNYRNTAENPAVLSYLSASRIQTLETFVHATRVAPGTFE